MFLRALLKVFAWSALIWGALTAATFPTWPPNEAGRPLRLNSLDWWEVGKPSLFVNQIQELVFEIATHCPFPPRKRLVILGSSGAHAFQPELLDGATSAEEVVNFSVMLVNFSQIRQIFADFKSCSTDQGMQQTTFLLAPSLGSFVSNRVANEEGYDSYESEKVRSHLYEGPVGAMRPLVNKPWLPLVAQLWRPVLLAGELPRSSRYLGSLLKSRLLHRPRPPQPSSQPSFDREKELTELIRLVPQKDAGETFASEQNEEVEQLIAEIRAAGSTIVMVEPPAQSWIRERSKQYSEAHTLLVGLAGRLSIPYIDLSTSGDGHDEEFYDPFHANHLGAPIWSARLKAALQELDRQEPGALGVLSESSAHIHR
jgi:hypothetical protein